MFLGLGLRLGGSAFTGGATVIANLIVGDQVFDDPDYVVPVSIDVSRTSMIYMVAVPNGDTAPDKDQIIAGTDASDTPVTAAISFLATPGGAEQDVTIPEGIASGQYDWYAATPSSDTVLSDLDNLLGVSAAFSAPGAFTATTPVPNSPTPSFTALSVSEGQEIVHVHRFDGASRTLNSIAFTNNSGGAPLTAALQGSIINSGPAYISVYLVTIPAGCTAMDVALTYSGNVTSTMIAHCHTEGAQIVQFVSGTGTTSPVSVSQASGIVNDDWVLGAAQGTGTSASGWGVAAFGGTDTVDRFKDYNVDLDSNEYGASCRRGPTSGISSLAAAFSSSSLGNGACVSYIVRAA